ncbi:hypothetical protein C8J57DRAFT_1324966 [Mycena rebaudengoi]|nr:hypothetical protein C8J57DRAFT_1324966 [Mycena rebaudengoi]
MHSPFKYFAILTAIAQLPQLSFSTWLPGKAAQINFYVGGACAQYTSEATSRWASSPLVGGNGAITGADTTSDTVEPDQANGWCMFWDGFDCTGNEVSSVYFPAGAAGGPCESAWSKDGFMWKSARCFIDATTTPALPESPSLNSTLASTPHVGHINRTTTPKSSSSTSLLTPMISSSHTSTTISSSASPTGYSSSISASPASPSTPLQSITRTTRNSLSSATIAGVITGAVLLAVVAILLAFCIWRRGRKKPEAILPYLLVSEQHGQEAHCGSPALSEKSRGGGVGTGGDSQPRSPTPGERRRHQSLVASELRALREEMERLNSAMRPWSRELQSYADADRLDPSLPGYLD